MSLRHPQTMSSSGSEVLTVLLFVVVLRLCHTQNGICYVTTSQVAVQSYYTQRSYTYQYDCSNLGWGWSYCTATGYTSTLMYSSTTAYVAQFTCCTGYEQVGTTQTCTESNECAPNGGLGPCQQICTNTVGSFHCSCNTGYTLSGYFCNDINECAPNGGLGPCEQICVNTIGSYYCSCLPGYSLSSNGAKCNDSNECASNGGLGPCQQICTNTVGSYTCSCQPGYMLLAAGTNCYKCFVSEISSSAPLSYPALSIKAVLLMSSTTDAANEMMSPTPIASVPNNTFMQVRLLDVADCSSWTIPAAQKSLFQSLIDNVNDFCKCNFTVESAKVICYSISRVTLRGTVRGMLLPYLNNWVMTTATTLNPHGIFLKVDNGCPVQIQSLDDPECPIGNVSATEAVFSDVTGLSTGITIGGVAAVVIIFIAALVAALLLVRRKTSSRNPIINPLYDSSSGSLPTDEHIYDTPQNPSETSQNNYM